MSRHNINKNELKTQQHGSQSPKDPNHRHQHSHGRSPNESLPYRAKTLSKHDLSGYRPMFGLYLDIQKRIDIETLDQSELRGRWKSFVGKWNRGELAEGWYDPKTLQKALAQGDQDQQSSVSTKSRKRKRSLNDADQADEDDKDDEDAFGPALPDEMADGSTIVTANSLAGPTIPTTEDVRARHEDEREQAASARDQHHKSLHLLRKAENVLSKERLEEVAPRADAGTRERQLEKKRDTADANRAFAAAKEGGGDVEIRDSDLMGGEDDLAELKRMKKEQQRKKNERELRREEMLRARMAETEEKMKVRREKEAKTMDMLKELAKTRFG